jgi:hypothetical protein
LLESEGIAAVFDADSSEEDPDAEVGILVFEEDLDAAREILASPDRAKNADEIEFDEDNPDRLADAWICPECRKRSLESMPLAPGWRAARFGCFSMVIIPCVVSFVLWLFPLRAADRFFHDLPNHWQEWYALVPICLGSSLFLAKRRKRCPVCGWETPTDSKS